jgi:hypothetical protein
VYTKSLVVVALCTIFVLAFFFVLSFETAGIGSQTATIPTTATTCSQSSAPCDTLTITSAALQAVNYTDELGTVNYATLAFSLKPLGGSPITSLKLFIGNTSAGTVQGPFTPGINRIENITLPSTISVSSGGTYVLSIEGSYGNSSTAWVSTRVTAE